METIGSIQVVATINTKDYDAGKKYIEKGNDDLEGNAKKTSSGFSAAWAGAVGGLVATVAQKGFAMISNSIDSAVKRVDTLNNSTRVFQNMGFSVSDTAKTMSALNKSIMGLPTSLNEAVSGVQLLAASTQDVSKSQKIFQALNDGILGFGGTSADVSNAVVQLSQDLAGGRIQAQTWNSLLDSGLGPTLAAMAKQMGMTTTKLKDGLSDGSVSVDQFTTSLINMDTQGGGGMKSLQKIVKDSTSGIGTGWANMQTAIVRGVATIVDSIGSQNISNAISSIGSAFESALKNVSGFMGFVKSNSDIFAPIAAGILTVVAAMTAWNVITKIIAASQAILNAVMAANPIGIIVTAIAALVAGLIYFFTQTKTGQAIWAGFVGFLGDSVKNIGNFFTDAWSSIASVWNGVVGFFQGVWNGVVGVFNGFLNFVKEWGLTILAIMFLPFSLLLGLIISNWASISAFFTTIGAWIATFFTSIWNGIVAIFTPIVQFYINIYTAAWNAIVGIWSVVVGWFAGVWNGIVRVFSGVAGWFGSVFRGAWNAITGVFNGIGGFFRGVWNTIVSIFGSVGTAVGNAIGNAFKSVVRGVLSGAINIINGFINTINGAIGIINKIPGVNIGKLGKLGVPNFAEGGFTGRGGKYEEAGIVHKGEYVVPKQYVNQSTGLPNIGGKTEYNIQNINISSEVDGDRWLRRLTNNTEIESSGLVPTQRYA